MKNNVPLKEYAILTENVQSISKDNNDNTIVAEYDFGNITYSYNSLNYLKERLPEISPIPEDIPKHKLYDNTQIVKIQALELYEVLSNFDYRLLWVKGIDKLEYEKNKVNRAGQKHKCLVNKNQEVEQITVIKVANSNQLVYGESTTNVPFTKRMNNYFVLEETDEGFTKLKVEVYADFKLFGILMKPLLKKNFNKIISKNIQELITLIDSGFTTKKTIVE